MGQTRWVASTLAAVAAASVLTPAAFGDTAVPFASLARGTAVAPSAPAVVVRASGTTVTVDVQGVPLPSPGYGLRIERISLEQRPLGRDWGRLSPESALCITVATTRPDPYTLWPQVVVGGYEVAQIPRAAVGRRLPRAWVLRGADGALIARSEGARVQCLPAQSGS